MQGRPICHSLPVMMVQSAVSELLDLQLPPRPELYCLHSSQPPRTSHWSYVNMYSKLCTLICGVMTTQSAACNCGALQFDRAQQLPCVPYPNQTMVWPCMNHVHMQRVHMQIRTRTHMHVGMHTRMRTHRHTPLNRQICSCATTHAPPSPPRIGFLRRQMHPCPPRTRGEENKGRISVTQIPCKKFYVQVVCCFSGFAQE